MTRSTAAEENKPFTHNNVIIFSNCKINLGLRVLRKRADGYHDLETVFYPIPFHDVIEVIRTEQPPVQFSTSGIPVDVAPEQNLCMKAYALLSRNFELPPVKLHLHKSIPSGAGLGGGSANAAFTLKLLNAKLNLGLSTEQLLDMALQLGSDCPFFIVNRPCFASGRGELFEPVDLSGLQQYKIAIVDPGIHISTAWAFSKVKPNAAGKSIKEIIRQPVETWREELVNDFEEAVFAEHAVLRDIKNKMYERGAEYAAMSGSGSGMYGLFKADAVIEGFERVKVFELG
ncbi:MAG TPA: 4-(cytidine 5'-diphospho)-2-C-methyl-D-erythritol kinase [Chitinophagaceae bacterium]|nr:4-(cytidine 5'-diphospho)-2-C-methyl-D-erythritol kinase [Chitinophagaceae bacterium]